MSVRRSRMRRKAGRSRIRGLPRTIQVTDRDLAIFRLLSRYRYLPANFIWELLPAEVQGASYKRYIERLGDLFHEGYLNRPRRQWEAMQARYRPCVYELDKRACSELSVRGFQERPRAGRKHYAHELLVATVQASLELSCRERPNLTYVPWSDILSYKTLPEATRTAPHPFRIPVVVDGCARSYAPDGTPAGIRYTSRSGVNVSLCFPGIEADCATESLERLTSPDRQSIAYKFRCYLDMARRKTYRSHFGFPNMLVPFVTTSEKRMKNMMAVLEKMTNGKGASFIIFNSAPHLNSFDQTPEPSALLLTKPWHRVGHEPFELVPQLEAIAAHKMSA